MNEIKDMLTDSFTAKFATATSAINVFLGGATGQMLTLLLGLATGILTIIMLVIRIRIMRKEDKRKDEAHERNMNGGLKRRSTD